MSQYNLDPSKFKSLEWHTPPAFGHMMTSGQMSPAGPMRLVLMAKSAKEVAVELQYDGHPLLVCTGFKLVPGAHLAIDLPPQKLSDLFQEPYAGEDDDAEPV